jgi:Pectate lyase superfamily protein
MRTFYFYRNNHNLLVIAWTGLFIILGGVLSSCVVLKLIAGESENDRVQCASKRSYNSSKNQARGSSQNPKTNAAPGSYISNLPQKSVEAKSNYGKSPVSFGDAVQIILPNNPDIALNIMEMGAMGDGLTDDTSVIQHAIYLAAQSGKAIYIPNGTYRITRELIFSKKDGKPIHAGPHIYGQSRDGVILRLDDNLAEFNDPKTPRKAVLRTVNAQDGATYKQISADFFNRLVTNLTINTGNNPGAVGIKFYSNNTGVLSNINIVGNGAIGLDLTSIALNGPHLIQNIEISGFDIGVRGGGDNSSTISNISVHDAKSYGLYHSNGVLQVEGLVVSDTPVAVYSKPQQPFKVTTLTLINGSFTGNSPSKPAIINSGVLFARNIRSDCYSKILESEAGSEGDVDGKIIDEYSSHGVSKAFASNVDSSLNLPIRYMPVRYDLNTTNWVDVKTYGANPNDKSDDTQAIQRAIDAATASGKTTLYFTSGRYILSGTVKIYGSIRHLIGFAPAQIIGNGKFSLINDPETSNAVQFQGFNFSKIKYENASGRPMLLHNLTGDVEATGPGEFYLNSTAVRLSISNVKSKVWARQLNTERPTSLNFNVINDGGTLWMLGQKTEQGGVKTHTINRGRTEILGAYIYALGQGKFDTVYEVENAEASFAGVRERTSTKKYANLLKETHSGEIRFFAQDKMPAGNPFNRGVSLYSAAQKSLPE